MVKIEIVNKEENVNIETNNPHLISDRRYYIYCYKKPNGEIFYIGKGTGHRYKRHLSEAKNTDKKDYKTNTIRKIMKNGEEPIIEIMKDNLTEDEAYELEEKLIKHYGRVNNGTGILTNLTDGGLGGRGLVWTQEMRDFHSKRMSGENNHMFGMKGELNPFYGKTHSEETIELFRKNATGREFSEETRKKISIATTGENNPMFGKKHSEESKKLMREISSGEKHPGYGIPRSEETKRRISEANKGRKFTDEHKRKISLARTGKFKKEENPNYGKGIPIIQVHNSGEITRWANAHRASESLRKKGKKVSPVGIYSCTNGKTKTHAGDKWYKEEEWLKLNGNHLAD